MAQLCYTDKCMEMNPFSKNVKCKKMGSLFDNHNAFMRCRVQGTIRWKREILPMLSRSVLGISVSSIFCFQVFIGFYSSVNFVLIVPLLGARYKFCQVIGQGQSAVLVAAEVNWKFVWCECCLYFFSTKNPMFVFGLFALQDLFHPKRQLVAIKVMNKDYSVLGNQVCIPHTRELYGHFSDLLCVTQTFWLPLIYLLYTDHVTPTLPTTYHPHANHHILTTFFILISQQVHYSQLYTHMMWFATCRWSWSRLN